MIFLSDPTADSQSNTSLAQTPLTILALGKRGIVLAASHFLLPLSLYSSPTSPPSLFCKSEWGGFIVSLILTPSISFLSAFFYPPSTPPLPRLQPWYWLTTSLLPLRAASPVQPRTDPARSGAGDTAGAVPGPAGGTRPGLSGGRRGDTAGVVPGLSRGRRGDTAGAVPEKLLSARRSRSSRPALWSPLHLMLFNEAGCSVGTARPAPGAGRSGRTKRYRPKSGGISREGWKEECEAAKGKKTPSTEIVNGPWMHWLVLMALVVLMDLLFVGGGELLPCFEF